MRSWIIAAGLCMFLFFIPLQCFFIGNDLGLGVQGAVYRFQMTVRGDSFILFTQEINYIIEGTYSGKTAISIIFWTFGTIVLMITTMASLFFWNTMPQKYLQFIIGGMIGASILYMASLSIQYGITLSGPAGSSQPLGIIMILISAIFLHYYQDWIYKGDDNTINDE